MYTFEIKTNRVNYVKYGKVGRNMEHFVNLCKHILNTSKYNRIYQTYEKV